MNKEKISNLLGLAQRAGKLLSGDFMVESALKKGKVKLLFMALDTAPNNKEKYQYLCEAQQVTYVTIFTKEELGRSIGKDRRVVVAVVDGGFANALQQLIESI